MTALPNASMHAALPAPPLGEPLPFEFAAADRLREEKSYLEDQLRSEWRFENIVGASSAFQAVMQQVGKVAPTLQTVLIHGEPGTEKELIARLIHKLSPRNREIFVKVQCAGYHPQMLEKKLFGYETPSLAGTISRRLGRVELAHQGTLFLEDVADLPSEHQARLLLALKEKLDIRVLASTSRNLPALVEAGKFNRELWQMLMPVLLPLVPLRKRSADIPLLASHFVSRFARQWNKAIHHIPQETMSILSAAPWPGNFRELENFIERAVMLTPGTTLRAPLLELEALPDENLHTAERKHILRILKETRGVIGGPSGAAGRLGLKRTTLNSKIKKLGIKRTAYPL